MASELNMYQAQVNEYKYEISRLMHEMNNLKKRYFEQKRKDQLEKNQTSGLLPQPISAAQPRFTGGGFSLATHG